MDSEAIEGELSRLTKKKNSALKEIDFAIKFAESNGVITANILKGIRKRLTN